MYPKAVFDDAHDERRRAEEEGERRRELLRQQVRDAFPEVTQFADKVREVFPGARIVWAAEKNNVVGKVPEPVRKKHEEQFGPLNWIGKEKK